MGGPVVSAGAGVFDIERGQAGQIRPDFWQTDTSVSKNSWGYIRQHQYKEAGEIVDDLVDVVSKNGTLLLNIGPRLTARFPSGNNRC
jgi:alpha-L-fucosidase